MSSNFSLDLNISLIYYNWCYFIVTKRWTLLCPKPTFGFLLQNETFFISLLDTGRARWAALLLMVEVMRLFKWSSLYDELTSFWWDFILMRSGSKQNKSTSSGHQKHFHHVLIVLHVRDRRLFSGCRARSRSHRPLYAVKTPVWCDSFFKRRFLCRATRQIKPERRSKVCFWKTCVCVCVKVDMKRKCPIRRNFIFSTFIPF